MADLPPMLDVFKMDDFRGLSSVEKIKFLDNYGDFKGLPTPEKVNFISKGMERQPEKPKDEGLFKTLGKDIGGLPAAIGAAAKNPVQAVKNVYGQMQDTYNRGQQETGPRRAALTVASGLPMIGPAAVQAGDEFAEGKPGQGAAHTAELLAPSAAHLLPDSVKLGPFVKNRNNPVQEQALKSVEKDVPMSVGQRMGQHGLQRVEQGLENFPGSAARASKARAATEDALATKGENLAQKPSPVKANAYEAGKGVQDRLQARIARLKGQADKMYTDVRTATAANKQTVQVGTQQSPVLGPNGQPVQTPVMKTLETPVDLAPVRQNLKPIYDDLMRSMPDARRANSPAFRELDELMKHPDAQMNAMDFDRTLSAIKSLTRDGSSPYLTSQSQRLAKQMIASGESEFQKSLAAAGPDVQRKLSMGRKAVSAYHNTAELLGDLREEPAALYSNLVTGGDKVFDTLQELDKVAPKELKTVGRTFLEGLVDKATKEGGFGRSAGIAADWNRLGPETKNLLFGKQLAGDLDNFMVAAKRLTSQSNPSGTAHMVAALGTLGAAGEAVRALITGGYGEAAAVVGGTVVLPNIAARALLTPEGARLLTKAVSLPVSDPAWKAAVTTLGGKLLQQEPSPGSRAMAGPKK